MKYTNRSADVAPAPEHIRLQMEERYHYALTATEDGIWDWNLEDDTGYLSPRYYEMLGYQPDEFAVDGKVWVSMIHPGDRAQVLKKIVELIQHRKESYRATYRLRLKNGKYRWFRNRAIVVKRNDKGVPVRLVGAQTDITRERERDKDLRSYQKKLKKDVAQQTEKLKATNLQLETILNTSSDSIWVCNGQGIILSINKAAENMLSIKAGDLIGKNIDAFEQKGLFDRSVTRQVLEGRRALSIMQTVPKLKKKLLVTGTPVFDDRGDIALVIVNERDLTYLNELRDKLQEAEKTNHRYREELTGLHLRELEGQDIIAKSKEMRQVLSTAIKLAKTKVSPILITGESGTGKGFVVKFIHSQTHKRDKPFVQINCAAIPEALLETELFGYEKGAFTGAREQGKMGLFEMAKGGTLFLDELGEMSLSVQAKLLKCIEDREIMHIGGLTPIPIDCTVIAATNQNLARRVKQKKFRQDLFFRLNTFTLRLPPLRRRPEDILEMMISFLKKYNADFGLNQSLSPGCLRKIQSLPLLGNVRELKNLIKKAVVMGEESILEELEDDAGITRTLPFCKGGPPEIPNTTLLKDNVIAYERQLIRQALKEHKTTRALARHLGLSQSGIVKKLKVHGLTHLLKNHSKRNK
ncbi:MAG: sigma 54-interacting transcriptional regulator [Desulfobacterales bacterium]|nr:sigma 54-interacting transcriptional regulator [Desulfobacterales bacterium]